MSARDGGVRSSTGAAWIRLSITRAARKTSELFGRQMVRCADELLLRSDCILYFAQDSFACISESSRISQGLNEPSPFVSPLF